MIVTGASRGIGAAIAQRLASDGYGVIVNYATDADGAESVVSAIHAKGGQAVAVRADIASEDDVEAMFDRAQEQIGPITALVNNAGTIGERSADRRAPGQRVDPADESERRGVDGVRQARRAGYVYRPGRQRRIDRDDRVRRGEGSGQTGRIRTI